MRPNPPFRPANIPLGYVVLVYVMMLGGFAMGLLADLNP